MESMSCKSMNSLINKGPKSTKTTRRFKSAIDDVLKLNDVGDHLIHLIFNLRSRLIDENDVWRVAWMLELRLDEFREHNDTRKEQERSHRTAHGPQQGRDVNLPDQTPYAVGPLSRPDSAGTALATASSRSSRGPGAFRAPTARRPRVSETEM